MQKVSVLGKVCYYKKGELRVWGVDDLKSGYGWLAYRAAVAFPPTLGADLWVFPPSDAQAIRDECKRRGIIKSEGLLISLSAVDGTELPAGWVQSLEETFHATILMVDHSGLSSKCPKYVGEFYPIPRTAFVKARQWQPPQQKVIGTLLTYHTRKGIELLVSLMWSIFKKSPEVRFKVVADFITASLLRNSVPPTVEILSGLSDEELVEFYLSLWAFLSLSMGEGGALPVAEAATLNVPIITPNHTAFSRLPASLRIGCVRQPAPIDAHLAGDIFIPNLKEVERIILENDTLPPPSEGDIIVEDIDTILHNIATSL